MNSEEIIEILDSWNFWTKKQDTGITRPLYLHELEKLSKTGQIVAVTGIRRSGKSTILRQFIEKKIEEGHDKKSFLYVNFEEARFAGLLSLDFINQIYKAYMEIVQPRERPWIFLDEVHNVPEWERFARTLHEKGEGRVFASGSNAELLSKEFGTLLTGRWVRLEVRPLNFREFLMFKGVKIGSRLGIVSQKTIIRQLLREYLNFGGFPLAAIREGKNEILETYFNDIIAKDVAERYRIRKVERLRALARYYLTVFSSHITYRKAAKFIGVSLDTVERFSYYLRDAFLVEFVPKFSYSLKEQELNPKIVYGTDSGLINIVSLRFGDNIGKLYENAVFLSLADRKGEIFYVKNKGECDFVVKKGQKIKEAVQVSYDITNKLTLERELKGLLEAMEQFDLSKGLIITDDTDKEEMIESRKIVYRPLWKWLLMD